MKVFLRASQVKLSSDAFSMLSKAKYKKRFQLYKKCVVRTTLRRFMLLTIMFGLTFIILPSSPGYRCCILSVDHRYPSCRAILKKLATVRIAPTIAVYSANSSHPTSDFIQIETAARLRKNE